MDGTDTKAKAICKPLGLSVRGTGGEHTPIGADGTCDISPSGRYTFRLGQPRAAVRLAGWRAGGPGLESQSAWPATAARLITEHCLGGCEL